MPKPQMSTREQNLLENRRPEIVEELIFKLANPADDTTISKLADMYQITSSELYRFKNRQSKEILRIEAKIHADEWESIGDKYKALAVRAIQRTQEMLDKASAKDASIIAQIATDKVLLLEAKGIRQVSVVHEHRHSIAGVSKLLLDEMNRRKLVEESSRESTEEADIIDVTPDDP
jgi:hypothetical protein